MGMSGTSLKQAGPTTPAEVRQEAELEKVTKQEKKRKDAMKRKRGGRASLISGAEVGLQETLG